MSNSPDSYHVVEFDFDFGWRMTLWAVVMVPSKSFLNSDQSGVQEKYFYSPCFR